MSTRKTKTQTQAETLKELQKSLRHAVAKKKEAEADAQEAEFIMYEWSYKVAAIKDSIKDLKLKMKQ